MQSNSDIRRFIDSRTLKKLSSAFLGGPIRVESYLITRARVRTLQSQYRFPSFTYQMPFGWKTPCYKIRGSILRTL